MVVFVDEARRGVQVSEAGLGAGRGNPSGILGWFAPMRWLMIGLLASLGALLFAAAGVARHVWLQRRQHRREMLAALDASHEQDQEQEL